MTKEKQIQEASNLVDNILDGKYNASVKVDKLLEETAYQTFFKKKLAKFGVKSPMQLDDAKRKVFFNQIEKEWTKEKK